MPPAGFEALFNCVFEKCQVTIYKISSIQVSMYPNSQLCRNLIVLLMKLLQAILLLYKNKCDQFGTLYYTKKNQA